MNGKNLDNHATRVTLNLISVMKQQANRPRTWELWERSKDPKPMRLQERDIQIIREVFRHRYLTVSHIYTLLGGSQDGLGKRCKLLFDHGYLERPKALRPTKLLTEQIVYALGKQGAKLLQHKFPELRIAELDWTETPKKQNGVPYIDHQLGVATFMVCLKAACDDVGVKLHWDGHFNRMDHKLVNPMDGSVLLPDAYFAIEVPAKGIAHHFLELDRGNVSLQRMYQKYLHYFTVWQYGQRKFKHFRVLTVTNDPDYVYSLRKTALPIGRDATHPHTWKALMFSHMQAFGLERPDKVLDPIWRYADHPEFFSLI